MAGLNGRGPLERGAFTGKGRGYCIAELPKRDYCEFGWRFAGRGMGRGWQDQNYRGNDSRLRARYERQKEILEAKLRYITDLLNRD